MPVLIFGPNDRQCQKRLSYGHRQMNIINIPLQQLQAFFLIFLRVGAIMMTVPLFGSKNIPVLLKAGLLL
ncbi:MAG: flagellar biosynthetic protein FliR, partial [Deltaproteobacteria bacterium]|nr:flagellar biosynthetic protein FliR [Deltaproteobacteria bacterium]